MNHNQTRRRFLLSTAALSTVSFLESFQKVFAEAVERRFPIGICDWDLRLTGNPQAFALAKELGYDGVEVSYPAAGEFSLSVPKNRSLFLEEAAT